MLVATFRFLTEYRELHRYGRRWVVRCRNHVPRAEWLGDDAVACMAALYALGDVHDFQYVRKCPRRSSPPANAGGVG